MEQFFVKIVGDVYLNHIITFITWIAFWLKTHTIKNEENSVMGPRANQRPDL